MTTLSAVLFQRGDWWVAQCLEYDVATQAKTLPGLLYELERVLVGHLAVSAKLGRRPFENLPPAPRQYWDMFEQSDIEIPPKRAPFRVPDSGPYPVPTPHLKIAA